MNNKNTDKIREVLGKGRGLTITEIVKVSKLSRYKVLIALAKLEGAKKVVIREVGMAKIYFLKKEGRENEK